MGYLLFTKIADDVKRMKRVVDSLPERAGQHSGEGGEGGESGEGGQSKTATASRVPQ